MLSEYKTTLSLKTIDDAEPLAKTILESTQAKLGFVPNMYYAMANSPGLLNTYTQGYSAFREKSGFSSMEQEVIFLAISQVNGCEYCMAAHSFLAKAASGVPSDVTAAIRDGKQVPEIQLSALSVFARLMVTSRGLPSQSEVKAFLSADYSDEHILEIIHAIAIKTISNYTNHIFHTEVDTIFSPHQWTGKKPDIKSVA
ncbi:MAG: carboxymuconolactone decarboxylase family protein [Gammaproteobacteria bacterium]|nr:carboxymuconolactone decarboxylase family protein [Gammaproteobacteria bacterium]